MAGAIAGAEKAAMVARVCIASVASSGQSGDVGGSVDCVQALRLP